MKHNIHIYLFSALISVLFLTVGCKTVGDQNNPVATTYTTTLNRTIIPDAVPVTPTVRIDDPANFAKRGYGTWHYGAGLPVQKRLDLLPTGYITPTGAQPAQLLRFFTITDIHITDKESPAQAIVFAPKAGKNGISCYSPLMLYSTQLFNATIQTINDIHKQNPFDLGLSLGDMINSDQLNELRWFIDILDGKKINPDSGKKDDPVAGTNNDYQDEFQAAGLDHSIPWYATIGNHDHLWLGSLPMSANMSKILVGNAIMKLPNILDATDKQYYSVGTLDGSTQYGTIIGAGRIDTMTNIPTIAPDSLRRSLTKTALINEFSKSTTLPAGHGFIQSNPANVFGGCYSFEPKSGLPLKIIVLDDTQDETDARPAEGIYGHGELNNGRYEWLMAQLQAGQAADKLMIISAHVPIGVCQGTAMDWLPATGYSSENNLIAQLQAFPNLILWVSGHRHLNNVTAFPSTDTTHPENSFWEVETKSLREFPEQFRTFDILRNSDNTISIITTNVDPNLKEGSLAATGRTYAIASNQVYGLPEVLLPTGSTSYNAELVKPLSTRMKEVIKNYVVK